MLVGIVGILLNSLLSCQVSVDIRSPAAGVITHLAGAEGDTVNVGVPFAEIDTAAAGEAAAQIPATLKSKSLSTIPMPNVLI